jgi:hypothetical protein
MGKANMTLGGGYANTQASFFSANSLTENVENMDKEQLKERLLVAEALLKKIYIKNKELEEGNSKQRASSAQTALKQSMKHNSGGTNSPHGREDIENERPDGAEYMQLIHDSKTREEGLLQEIEEQSKVIEELKAARMQEISNSPSNKADKHKNYVKFLEKRVEEGISDNKRYL